MGVTSTAPQQSSLVTRTQPLMVKEASDRESCIVFTPQHACGLAERRTPGAEQRLQLAWLVCDAPIAFLVEVYSKRSEALGGEI
jgi:hypothetical protein